MPGGLSGLRGFWPPDVAGVPVLPHDLPCAGVPVRVAWRMRRYCCHEKACEVTTFSEVDELAVPRAKLTTRAIAWAMAQLRAHDIAV